MKNDIIITEAIDKEIKELYGRYVPMHGWRQYFKKYHGRDDWEECRRKVFVYRRAQQDSAGAYEPTAKKWPKGINFRPDDLGIV